MSGTIQGEEYRIDHSQTMLQVVNHENGELKYQGIAVMVFANDHETAIRRTKYIFDSIRLVRYLRKVARLRQEKDRSKELLAQAKKQPCTKSVDGMDCRRRLVRFTDMCQRCQDVHTLAAFLSNTGLRYDRLFKRLINELEEVFGSENEQ